MTTSNQLVENIKARSLVPSTQNTISDETILRWANDEVAQFIVPMIKEFNEEFFVVEEVINILPNQDTYKIPQRALGGGFRNISMTHDNGDMTPMTRIGREEKLSFAGSGSGFYFIQGNSIRLANSPTNKATMTIAYLRRPNQMVFADGAKQITQVLPSSGLIQVSSAPEWLKTGNRFDVVDGLYPSDLPIINAQAINIAGNKITLADVSGVKVGDFLSLAGTTHLVPIQEELVQLLEERTVLRIFAALGDEASVATTQNNIAEMQKAMGDLIDNRASGDPTILVNHYSPMRMARR